MWKVIVLAALFILSTLSIQEQGSIRVDSLRVDIWSEFDRPAVLIIYHISLKDNIPLPVILNLNIPKQAEVNAVAVEDPALGLLNADYSQTVAGDWAILSITATTYKIQVEYYDVLIRNGLTRRVVYTWLGDVPVDTFNVLFQSPVGAENLVLNPAPISSQLDQYGLLNYLTDSFSLAKGDLFTLEATYIKTDDELSVSNLPVQPVIPLEETSGQVAWRDTLPWILGALGLVLIILGLFVLFGFANRSGKAIVEKQPKPSHKGRTSSKVLKVSDQAYCNECGRRAETGDQYCRSCGARLQHKA